jgi:hypothetical protein
MTETIASEVTDIGNQGVGLDVLRKHSAIGLCSDASDGWAR